MNTRSQTKRIEEVDEQELIKKLEKKGEEEVKKIKSNKNATADAFMNIIKDGMKEFEEKTGRGMTYSEMREAYG